MRHRIVCVACGQVCSTWRSFHTQGALQAVGAQRVQEHAQHRLPPSCASFPLALRCCRNGCCTLHKPASAAAVACTPHGRTALTPACTHPGARADVAVQAMAIAALPVLACVMILDGMNAVVAGVLRGAGRQRLGAIVNGAACALAIPAAWLLAFKMKLGVPGAWMGVGLG